MFHKNLDGNDFTEKTKRDKKSFEFIHNSSEE